MYVHMYDNNKFSLIIMLTYWDENMTLKNSTMFHSFYKIHQLHVSMGSLFSSCNFYSYISYWNSISIHYLIINDEKILIQ